MERKDIEVRLEVIKLLVTIGDKEGIELQANALKEANNSQLDEIVVLLEGSNYRQALYLVKKYISEHGSRESFVESEDESEKVLGVEDMLRMSPLAKETIKDYRAQAYTEDDLAKFAQKTIEKNSEESDKKQEVARNKEIKKEKVAKKAELKHSKIEEEEKDKISTLIEDAHQDVPLDEISASIIGKKEKKQRTKVLSKYKTLREKFARKEKIPQEDTEESSDNSNITSSKSIEEISVLKEEATVTESQQLSTEKSVSVEDKKSKSEEIVSEEESSEKEVQKENADLIYSPIPHIEEKLRQFFILYPPVKESDVWVEVVIKFLKNISKNSYTQKDVENFLEEFHYFTNKNDLAKAAQVILLAGATDSKFAQFSLARELFSGRVLQRNLKKSFEIIKVLAADFYPEAVCDLAQFYEYGIGVPKDKKIALRLYEKAFEVGSVRASKHINRIKESGGFLSSLLKLN